MKDWLRLVAIFTPLTVTTGWLYLGMFVHPLYGYLGIPVVAAVWILCLKGLRWLLRDYVTIRSERSLFRSDYGTNTYTTKERKGQRDKAERVFPKG